MTAAVNSYRYLDRLTRRVIHSWIEMESPREIPWTKLAKPVAQSRVALISSGGIALKTDKPFDQEGEKRNPWWGDPSYRILPDGVTTENIKVYHQHVNPTFPERDINCLLPVDRLKELEASGEIGSSAPRHYSYMGYILMPEQLLAETTPAIIRNLQEDEVEIVVLVPA